MVRMISILDFIQRHPYEVYCGGNFEGRFTNLSLAAITAHQRSTTTPSGAVRSVPLPASVICDGRMFSADDCRRIWTEWWNRQQMIMGGGE